MAFLSFALIYPFVWILSRLPLRILYIISDILFFFMYYVVGYRKKVVFNNIQLAFPEKTTKEQKIMVKLFFKHFVDLLFESIKFLSISEREIRKRYKYLNPELVNEYASKGKSIALMGAHQANWEWSASISLALDIPVFGTYSKLANKYFDKFVYTSRTKFGVGAKETSKTVKQIQEHYNKNIQGVYVLISDQSPQVHKTFHWAKFLNVKVPVHTGAEMLAKKFDFVVVNYVAKKVKRGYYEITFELITDTPKQYKNYEITEKYLAITEKNVREQPELYLWSHRRFKHKDKYNQWLQMKKKSNK